MASANKSPTSVLVAPDKFKGTLTARAAAAAITAGLQRAWPHAKIHAVGLADGGEGFTETLVEATHGCLHSTATVDALGRACVAAWGQLGDGSTACVDLAAASGLAQIPRERRDPTATSTYGTGVILREIAARGFRDVIIGLGGSATNDGGIGAAAALGFRFLDAQGAPVALTGRGLKAIARMEWPQNPIALRIVVATDVDNPLHGAGGAAHQFAAQKGATPEHIEMLDDGLRHLAAVVQQFCGRDLASAPGAGAAGGSGFGFMTLLDARRSSGFDVIRAHLRLDELIRTHQLVVTGEGAFDQTSLSGKGPGRIANLARQLGVPVWGIFGRLEHAKPDHHFDRWAALQECDAEELLALSPCEHARRVETSAYDLAAR